MLAQFIKNSGKSNYPEICGMSGSWLNASAHDSGLSDCQCNPDHPSELLQAPGTGKDALALEYWLGLDPYSSVL